MAMTTLIVDDHALFRSTARMLLESEGYVVVGEAADGAEAVAAATALHPDLMVLDVQLPDPTGFEVSRRLAREGFSGRIVLVSSRAASEYGELVSDSGAIGFIAKDQLSGAALARLLEQGDLHAHTAD